MQRFVITGLLALALAACGNAPAATGDEAEDHSAMDHAAHTDSSEVAAMSPAQQAYAAVNERMHAGMADIPADADVAFMQGMLAHHRGAVEMSQVALDHGKDEQARDLAERIIAAQQAEIDEMEAWLAARVPPSETQ